MNINTGELIRLTSELDPEMIKKGFRQVPDDLTELAEKELGESDSVFVDMEQDTPLTQWAKQHRKNNIKSRRKMAKRSKKVNHRK